MSAPVAIPTPASPPCQLPNSQRQTAQSNGHAAFSSPSCWARRRTARAGDLRERVNGRQGHSAATSRAIAVLAVAQEEKVLQLALPSADTTMLDLDEKPAQDMEHRSNRAGRRRVATP
ncbi:unnamed protein product [Urochloa humidicola]